jgi:death-on-curing protein
LITETGGEHGVHDLALLLSALGRPQATFEDKELSPDLFTKTAALMDSLVRTHPFVDGNRRTAITSSGMFLQINGFRLMVENSEMVRFALACAQSQLSFDEIVNWFQRYSFPIKE